MIVTEQHLLENGVLTFFEDESVDLLPYKMDENGEQYVDLFPNGWEDMGA